MSHPSPMPASTAARLWQKVKRGAHIQESPWLAPWHRGGTERERLVRGVRATALRLVRSQNREQISPWIQGTRILLWPLLLPYQALDAALPLRIPGFSRRFARGFLDLVLYNIRPKNLRTVREYRPGHHHLARLFVTDRENQAILIQLNRHASNTTLGDKITFDRFCHQHRLPHIPLLAWSHGDTHTQIADWPAEDMFVKAANLWGGQEAHVLSHNRQNHTWQDQTGQVINAGELPAWLAQHYPQQMWLIQPMLRVDPLWSQWSPGPLGTVRVVTVIVQPGEQPEIIAASMRLPRAGMLVDNFSAGALSAEIDWRTGKLGPALGHDPAHRWHDHHPDTGGLINGATVPDWPKLCALAIAAHAAAPDLMTIGWDLTCHDSSPVLIEANPVFNLAPTVVLGETRWLEAILNRQPLL
jgi:hypothetical protein